MIKRRSSGKGAQGHRTSRAISRSDSAYPPMRPWLRSDDDHTKPSDQSIVDLADRHSDDLDVVLLWARGSGRLWVTVTHRRSGRTARINATAANALDVFRHPFAYERAAV
jgi:hypothetical protein